MSAVHKANIMKKADGLFLECCREVRGRAGTAAAAAAAACAGAHMGMGKHTSRGRSVPGAMCGDMAMEWQRVGERRRGEAAAWRSICMLCATCHQRMVAVPAGDGALTLLQCWRDDVTCPRRSVRSTLTSSMTS